MFNIVYEAVSDTVVVSAKDGAPGGLTEGANSAQYVIVCCLANSSMLLVSAL